MIPCSQCGTAPERRLDQATDRKLYACLGCRHRGEATTSEESARGSWQQVNDPELPPHKCKDGRAPRFFIRTGGWGARCDGCGHEAAGYGSLSGARAGWARSMR